MAAIRKKVTQKGAENKGNKNPTKKLPGLKQDEACRGLKKEYLKNKQVCKVTFQLPKIAAANAENVYLVGDFNNWNIHEHRMKKLKNGNFTVTLPLKAGTAYQYRYLVDEAFWENDWHADKYVKSPYGDSDNSVVIV